MRRSNQGLSDASTTNGHRSVRPGAGLGDAWRAGARLAAVAGLAAVGGLSAVALGGETVCNPMNLSYGYTPFADEWGTPPHRATADPVIVPFKGAYYLFSTNQWGYWWSEDLSAWSFVPRRFLKPKNQTLDELCAPAAWVMNDELYLIGSTYTTEFTLWKSASPRTDTWTEAKDPFGVPAWDPAFFVDDDGRLYLYHGSSNTKPIYGVELDARTFAPIGEQVELVRAEPDRHGWERFGEHHDNTFLAPFVEGAWMTKHGGRYYLQYAAPGTEFSGYADGVYVGDGPLGPFEYQAHNPVAMKPGGFARGAGHGSMFADEHGNWWRTGTMAISVNNNFERRLGLWPAGFDADGVMFCTTAYGDYPMRLPDGPVDAMKGLHTGWMLLNYAKPARASSTLGALGPNLAVDEDIRTHWSAVGVEDEWFESDLGAVSTVHAVQVNFADQDASVVGNPPGRRHRYRVLAAETRADWQVIVDKTAGDADVPHDYVELEKPVRARLIRVECLEVPTGRFALSGLRVFGRGDGSAPEAPEGLRVLRGVSEARNAWLKWDRDPLATGYMVYAGSDAQKLYTSVMVMGSNELWFRAMDVDRPHYFQIEAFNENGISSRSAVVRIAVPTAATPVLEARADAEEEDSAGE